MALTPPLDMLRADGTPIFWGTEEEAWAEFQAQLGSGA